MTGETREWQWKAGLSIRASRRFPWDSPGTLLYRRLHGRCADASACAAEGEPVVCGIVGYIGEESALPVLLDGLERLEYRGYDSAGLAVGTGDQILIEKHAGRVAVLTKAMRSASERVADAHCGIAHTRWATHGVPTDINAHPHTDEQSEVAVVHNGIIENHAALRQELTARGHTLHSETDSEVVVHLIEEALNATEGGPEERFLQAVQGAVSRLRGSFALAVMWTGAPDRVVGVRQHAPLVIGVTASAHLLASDVAALVAHTRNVVFLRDGEMALLRPQSFSLYSFTGQAQPTRATERVPWDVQAAERGGYAHFMLKEIHEQPEALRQTLASRLTTDGPELGTLAEIPLDRCRRAWFLGCGTAYHAALVGQRLMENWAGLPSEADLGSEFRYRDPLVSPGDLAIAVSQSGETADTLAAFRQARDQGAVGLAITNVMASSLARDADQTLYTWAGPEVAVCSTKAYTTQVELLALVALETARRRRAMGPADVRGWARALEQLPRWAEDAIALETQVRGIAAWLAEQPHCFFIGRGLDWAIAMEGQLKLKEVSYLSAEAYAAGELKHGSLALVDTGTPVVALFTQPHLAEKMAGNVAEARARGGRIVAVATSRLAPSARPLADELLILPDVPAPLAPVIAVIPLQLLAYHAAVLRGTDVDKPRNLAKSVTVE